MSTTLVRVAETSSDIFRVIEIDAPLGASNQELLWRTLFDLRTQIVMAECRVVGDRLLHRLHVTDVGRAATTSA